MKTSPDVFWSDAEKSAGKLGRSRLRGFAENHAIHGLRRYFWPMGRTEEEIPEAENEKQLAGDNCGNLKEKPRPATHRVVFF